jgi:hypothetical protein
MLTSSLLVVASAAVVLSSTIPPATTTTTNLPACASQMDGKLPYYQPLGFNFSGNIRRYYVAAEVDTWDYAPTGKYLPRNHINEYH